MSSGFYIFATRKMKNKTQKYLLLIAGLLVAICVIASQSIVVNYDNIDGQVITEQSSSQSPEDASEERGIPTISITSLPAAVIIHFTQQASCLFEIVFGDATNESIIDKVDLPLTKFFSTLLSVIISPNAP